MFDWKPEYSVKIPAIDAQHKRLFALAGELHDAMSHGRSADVLEQSLARLVDYTKDHFAAEERLMDAYKYSELPAHRMEHEKLTAQVMEFQEKFRRRQALLSVELLQFLKTWLEKHISGSDQKYAVLIRGKMAA
jgi:hemerythrin